LWWALTEGAGGWAFGAVVVALAGATSLWLARPGRGNASLRGTLRFVPFFLMQSLRGGIDVAYRAFHPRLPIAPAWRVYPLRLPEGPARVFLMNAITLMPGTLSVEAEGNNLRIHVLDGRLPIERGLGRLEAHVARAFGVGLAIDEGTARR
jgi:multicomponent Na+:H+ antiporter subunit E